MTMDAAVADTRRDHPTDGLTSALRRALESDAGRSERALAQDLGVTRHVLRRALAALRAEGGAPPSHRGKPAARALQAASAVLAQETNPLEIMEIRLALEPSGARLAALRAAPAEIARIRQAATTPPGGDYVAGDREFHAAVAAGARNGLAAAIGELLRRIAAEEQVRLPPHVLQAFGPGRLAERDAEHMAVAAAIALRDPDRAEAAMRSHLQAVQRKMMERLVAG